VFIPIIIVDVDIIHKNYKELVSPFLNISTMVLENVIVAFFNQNGITFHSKNHDLVVITTVFQTFSSAVLIC